MKKKYPIWSESCPSIWTTLSCRIHEHGGLAKRLDGFLEFNGNELLTESGKNNEEKAKLHAEAEFEKYRIIRDRLYESDFDQFLMLEQSTDGSLIED